MKTETVKEEIQRKTVCEWRKKKILIWPYPPRLTGPVKMDPICTLETPSDPQEKLGLDCLPMTKILLSSLVRIQLA